MVICSVSDSYRNYNTYHIDKTSVLLKKYLVAYINSPTEGLPKIFIIFLKTFCSIIFQKISKGVPKMFKNRKSFEKLFRHLLKVSEGFRRFL